MKALIDTCVIIDVLQNREPFCREAQVLFLAVANKSISGCVTAKSLTDVYYLMRRSTHNDKKSREILNKLLCLFMVEDTMGIDCRKAIDSPISDFEDALMAETALRIKADCIVTRNKAGFRKSAIAVFEPAELIEKIASDNV